MTARQKVLTYITKNRTASVREISRSLKMSAPTVRHHLRTMVADGRLVMESVRRHEGRGRPEKVFSLPKTMMGDNLSALAEVLLAESGSRLKADALAKRLAGNANFSSQLIAKRLNSVVEKMNQMNYHARWEAGADGPRVLFAHCPYAAIVYRHPELCDVDVNLVSQLTARPVRRESKSETQRGGCPCVFLIR